MIPGIIFGVSLLFAGCASWMVNKKDDGTFDAGASSRKSEEAAVETVRQYAADYCEDRDGYISLQEPQVHVETITVPERDCSLSREPGGEPDFSRIEKIIEEKMKGPYFARSVADSSADSFFNEPRCPSVFRDVTWWTAKLNFKCNDI